MKPKVIVISGKARNGKDAVGSYMEEEFCSFGHAVWLTHYADLLKHICTNVFGWDGKKDESGRLLLQTVGTEVRGANPDFWVNFIASILSIFKDENGSLWDYVIIPDCRYPNEINTLKEYGYEVYHIQVVRPWFDNGLTEEQKNHDSENALNGITPDLLISNTGTLDELRLLAKMAADNIMAEDFNE